MLAFYPGAMPRISSTPFAAIPAALDEALRQYRADSFLTRDANPDIAPAVWLVESQLANRLPLSIRR
jgi:hypothetical protein